MNRKFKILALIWGAMMLFGYPLISGAQSPLPVTRIQCSAVVNPDSLKTKASVIENYGDYLLIGARDGRISVYDIPKHAGYAIVSDKSAGIPKLLYKNNSQIFWVTREPASLVCFKESVKELVVYDLSQAGLNSIADLSIWNGMLAVFSTTGISFIDLESGNLLPVESIFPPEIAADLRISTNRFIRQTDRMILMSCKFEKGGYVVRARALSGTELSDLGSVAVPEAVNDVISTPQNIYITAGNAIYEVSLTGNQFGLREVLRNDMAGRLGRLESATASNNIVWWKSGSNLFRWDTATGNREAYLPWNIKGLSVESIASHTGDLWVATNLDIRRLSASEKSKSEGYSGFVKAKLSNNTPVPNDPVFVKMSRLVEEWQGAPYKWGGASKTGTDCSGFVMSVFGDLGIKLPHGSKYLASHSKGEFVKDEIRYGDVLVMNGHTALYIGDVKTAETLPKQGVAYGSILPYRPVCVRRFVDAKNTAVVAPAVKNSNPKPTFAVAVRYIKNNDEVKLKSALAAEPGLATKADAAGTTLLHWAADKNNVAIAKTIIASGGKTNARNNKGVTPLHVAASLGHAEVGDLLIQSGASASIKDKQGRTPLDLAILHNKLRVAAIIAGSSQKK